MVLRRKNEGTRTSNHLETFLNRGSARRDGRVTRGLLLTVGVSSSSEEYWHWQFDLRSLHSLAHA